MYDWKAIQVGLQAKGFYKTLDGHALSADGIPGHGTHLAVDAFERSVGLPIDWPDPSARVLGRLGVAVRPPQAGDLYTPPWGVILNAKMGLNEVRDKAALEAFLRSDGSTLGDPSVFPWCGDLAETVMLNSGFGPVPGNPYLARNWAPWGVKAAPGYYALAVYGRPGPKGNEGHVGFIIGTDGAGARDRVRGGNEQNQIGDVWIASGRRLGIRLPTGFKGQLSPLPVLDSKGQPLSTNEA